MLKNGRCMLTIQVRPAVYAAVERMAAKLRGSKQTVCEKAIEGAVELEIEREFKPAVDKAKLRT
jgi:predicted transcriptional regulator